MVVGRSKELTLPTDMCSMQQGFCEGGRRQSQGGHHLWLECMGVLDSHKKGCSRPTCGLEGRGWVVLVVQVAMVWCVFGSHEFKI